MRFFDKIMSLLLLLTFIFTCTFSYGQEDPTKVRLIPTVEGDADTEFLFSTHLIDKKNADSGQELRIADDRIDTSKRGAYVEYQIKSGTSGNFIVHLLAGTQSSTANLNVGVYKVGEQWPEEGTGETVLLTRGEWTDQKSYYFPITVEANQAYVMRIRFLDETADNWVANIHNIAVEEEKGSIDATLKSLTIDGKEVEGFNSGTYTYNIALPLGTQKVNIAAEANDDKAQGVAGTGEHQLMEGKNEVVVTVTAESGLDQEYTLNLFLPLSVQDGSIIRSASDAFKNNGIAGSDTKLNQIATGDYIEYYVYSETDQSLLFHVNCTNGYDTPNSYLNINDYGLDEEWVLDENKSINIPFTNWNSSEEKFVEMTIDFKANEARIVRIYGITDQNNAADIFGIKWHSPRTGSDDADLKDLTIDGQTIEGFDPSVINYTFTYNADVSSINIGGLANDDAAQAVEGIGDKTLEQGKNQFDIKVTSESGVVKVYTISIFSPIEVVDGNTFKMATDAYDQWGLFTLDHRINETKNNAYVEYLVYSKTDLNASVIIKCANGYDVDNSYLNVSAYKLGEDWVSNPDNSHNIPFTGTEGDWDDADDRFIEAPIQLVANELMVLRIHCIDLSGKNNVANIYNMTFAVDDLSDNANLSALTVDGNSVIDFDPAITNYTIDMPSNITEIEIGATAENQAASISGLGTVSISADESTHEVVVTAPAGNTKTYTINIAFTTPNLATLSDLKINDQTIDGFESGQLAYHVSLEANTIAVEVSATATDPTATIEGVGTVDLSQGNLVHEVSVRLNESEIQVYTINFTVSASEEATLSALSVDDISVPSFDPETDGYNVVLAAGTTQVNVAAIATDDKAQIEGTGTIAILGTEMEHQIRVVAEAGNEKIYLINFSVEVVNASDLSKIPYHILTKEGRILISGLEGREAIAVYELNGRLVHRSNTFNTEVNVLVNSGVYIVNIDNYVIKIFVP
ncbi:cadherin-like beta sandwich domain-containing protein [Persicobacter psychrovividus]|uniref:Cadherin-like beta-sandwich-like domain-containing protein n=1 Tax=Persicobacter psychrovividus TaxID=387638 RepID=A0ABN6LFU6_9BACT|nr:hypothetical protein PEPS_43300 [Persicobacter psychrovividus]